MEERHENEQYFFDAETVGKIADLLQRFPRPCVVCAPSVGEELERRKVDGVATLDIDERFSHLRSFTRWDLYRPTPWRDSFDVIFCDPPFYNVSLSQLFHALRLLAQFDYAKPLAVAYLVRRQHAILGTFARFGLKPTGIHPSYVTVQSCDRNDIEIYANFDTVPSARASAPMKSSGP